MHCLIPGMGNSFMEQKLQEWMKYQSSNSWLRIVAKVLLIPSELWNRYWRVEISENTALGLGVAHTGRFLIIFSVCFEWALKYWKEFFKILKYRRESQSWSGIELSLVRIPENSCRMTLEFTREVPREKATSDGWEDNSAQNKPHNFNCLGRNLLEWVTRVGMEVLQLLDMV